MPLPVLPSRREGISIYRFYVFTQPRWLPASPLSRWDPLKTDNRHTAFSPFPPHWNTARLVKRATCRGSALSDGNRITLKSYAEKFREYDANSSQDVTGPSKDWIDKVLAQFPKDAKIFEIGTAHARDARYIAGKGYSLMCSDAIDEFVGDIHRKGFKAVKFNVLNDGFSKYYDIIIANAVLPHFDDSEFDIVLKKTIDALNPGGVFAFTIKAGEGSE